MPLLPTKHIDTFTRDNLPPESEWAVFAFDLPELHGWPDTERGQIVKAMVGLKPGVAAGPDLVKSLQEHVKNTLAPYKYPRAVEFIASLPKTPTGKLQRSALRPGGNT